METLEPTCVRGFSITFPASKKFVVSDADLQFIEGSELARTWKAAHRQRLKQQEDKIWSEFVNEQDVLQKVCAEDPYQFLTHLPESQIKDLLQSELYQRKQKDDDSKEQKRGAGDSPRDRSQPSISFSQVEHDEVFHIFDEDYKEEDSDNENLNDTPESPLTVREREKLSHDRAATMARASGLSVPPSYTDIKIKQEPENVASLIESSIYCARVKELRLKIDAELRQMIIAIENLNIVCIDPWTLRKMCYRAAEYSTRFQRIHLYQLQRQTGDIKRHNAMALPFAKHTQFQSQMVRIVTLHQTTLASLQVFHKSFEQTACLRECSDILRGLCDTIRESTKACVEVAAPADFVAAKELYNDNVLSTVNMLESTVCAHMARVKEYITASDKAQNAPIRKSPRKKKKKSIGMCSQNGTKHTSKTEAHLSMYSMETLRLNQKGSNKHTAKLPIYERYLETQTPRRKKGNGDKDTPKSHRKSPRSSRKPLMRDPHSGRERKKPPRHQTDTDIHTMVEAVEPPSSQISREQSPTTPRKHKAHAQPKNMFLNSPRSPRVLLSAPPAPAHPSPVRAVRKSSRISPRAPLFKRTNPYVKPTANIRNETQDPAANAYQPNEPMTPVSKIQIQCSKKDIRETEKETLSDCTLKVSIAEKSEKRQDGTKTPKSQKSSGTRIGIATSDSTAAAPVSARSDSTKTQDAEKGIALSKILKQLCGGDSAAGRNERVTGAKNAQLVTVGNANTSPRQPTTPQLLRILEETIQKKIPKHLYMHHNDPDDRLRLAFNIPQKIADHLFQYRTKFVQHMLTSSMYANSAVGKPWEMIGSVSERIIDEIILDCASELEMSPLLQELVKAETR